MGVTLSLAILGAAHVHTREYLNALRDDGVHLAGIHDSDIDEARRLAKDFDVAVRDVQEILADDNIDGVVVCAKTSEHLAITRQVALCQKPLFLEKPLAHTREDAEAICELVNSRNLTFQTGFFLRYDPDLDTLANGSGSWSAAFCHNGYSEGLFEGPHAWMADMTQSGLTGFADMAIHLFAELTRLQYSAPDDIKIQWNPEGSFAGSSGRARWTSPEGDVTDIDAGWDGPTDLYIKRGEQTVRPTAKPADALLAFVAHLRGEDAELTSANAALHATLCALEMPNL